MVAITVAIAATVYVYVSGMLGGGTQKTPSVGISADPSGTSCVVEVSTVTETGVAWSDCSVTLTNLTTAEEIAGMAPTLPSGTISGGDVISVPGSGTLTSGSEYRVTLSYTPTGGSMGTVTWTQP
jgi:FlaG/FlaF family flagellin (archaellin)